MSVAFRWDGFAELLKQFATLPQDLTQASAPDVDEAAALAVSTIRAGYPRRTGNLKDGLTTVRTLTGSRVQQRVINTSPHAVIFERGTQARHNSLGAFRGSMPANPIFTATMMRERQKLLTARVPNVLVRFGLKVLGV